MHFKYKASCAGFSLLECLASLSIIAIFVMFAVPNMQRFLQQRQAKQLQADLTATLQFASHYAVASMHEVQMCYAQHAHCSGVETSSLLLKQASSPLTQLKIDRRFRLHYRNFPAYRSTIAFSAERNDNATFWLCNAEQNAVLWALSLSANGKVQAMHADGNGEFHASDGMRLAC